MQNPAPRKTDIPTSDRSKTQAVHLRHRRLSVGLGSLVVVVSCHACSWEAGPASSNHKILGLGYVRETGHSIVTTKKL
jgi:hypothetical protein